LEGVRTRSESEALAGTEIFYPLAWKPEADEPDLEEDLSWLAGFRVVDERHGNLGTVQDVDAVLMQDQLVVDYNGLEVLIPFVDEIVLEIDADTETIRTRMPEGLLEVFTDPNAPEEDFDENGETPPAAS